MHIDEFEQHLRSVGLPIEHLRAGEQIFLRLAGLRIAGGANDGRECDAAILRTTESPWVPQPAIHVRPHLVPMGQMNSQASPIGADWQYLSRRFDRVPTPKSFLAHILKVLGET